MKNILIVEDDPFCNEFYSLILRKAGYEPILIDNVDDIENFLKTREYSLIIMDINLKMAILNGKRVDGIMISNYLKNNLQYSHIPIILVTAYSMASLKSDILSKSKAEGLITKPISDINQFISKLESVML